MAQLVVAEADSMLANQPIADVAPDGIVESLLATMKLANKLSALESFSSQGLTTSEWLLLSVFPADGGPIVIRRLSALTGLTVSRVKVLLVNLEGNGLIEGSVSESGRTTQPYSLTESGVVKERSIRSAIARLEKSLATPAQLRIIVRATRILNRLSKGFVDSTLQKPAVAAEASVVTSGAGQQHKTVKRPTSRK